ncbi:MAG: hypothetical protein CVV27_03300 [Candidatus Melainabacteria bacterium HGW-Melainabacteria-1]|nr:MAG: hypothetical protein CVV27_03300 [Candidatus Melainabacteria bacterium HGW-Melainabacteria-1]
MIKKFIAFGILAATTLATVPPALAESFRSFLTAPVNSLDPLYLESDASRQLGQLVHRGLVAYSPTIMPPRNGAYHQVVPALASSWEIAPDRKSYIFTLNPEARFHNGRAVTAADVKYSFERAANPNLGATDYWAIERLNIKGLRRYQAATRAGIKEPHLLGVEVIDHHIVQLHLEQAIPYALEMLALPIYSIVPAEDVERWWKDYRVHPVGAGPYQLAELKPGQPISLQRFDKYYDTRLPRTESLTFQLLNDPKDQFLAFTRRELDHAPLPATYLRSVLADPVWNPLGETRMLQASSVANLDETRVLKTPSWSTHFISMNNQVFPFSDPKVRQAFNYAVDKRYIIQHQLQTYAHPVTGIFPPDFPGATRRDPVYAHDPERARKLLFEAGWRDKDADGNIEPWQNPHLNLTLYYRDPEDSYLICRKIQADLAAIGVKVKLEPLKHHYDRHPGQAPNFFHTAVSPEILDPSQIFHPTFYSGALRTNISRYANPRVDELVANAEDLNYEPKRYELYREAERLILDDAPWLFLYHPVSYQLVQPRVKQYTVHPALPFAYEFFDLGVQTAGK